jgi:hypothetical protein
MEEVTFNIICAQNSTLFRYVLDWCSSKIRFPWKKLVSTLNLYSPEQRVGKGLWCNVMFKGLGIHSGYTANRNQLMQRFTSHLAKYVILIADECSFSDDRRAHGMMKAFVTEPKMAIEAKFEEIQIVDNLCNLICISNELLSTYADPGDMRQVMLRCLASKAGDWRFFSELVDALSADDELGLKAIFFYLAYDHKISEDFGNGQQIPVTDLQNIQAEATVDSVFSYIRNILDEGQHVSPFDLTDSNWKNEHLFEGKFGGREEVRLRDIKANKYRDSETGASVMLQDTTHEKAREIQREEDHFWVRMVDRTVLYEHYKTWCTNENKKAHQSGYFFKKLGEVFDESYDAQSCLQKKNVLIYSPNLTRNGTGGFIFENRHSYDTVKKFVRYAVLPTLAKARERYVMVMKLTDDPWSNEDNTEQNKRQRTENERVKRITYSDKGNFELFYASYPCIMSSYINSMDRDTRIRSRKEYMGRDNYYRIEDVNYFAMKGIDNRRPKEKFDVSKYVFKKVRDLNAYEEIRQEEEAQSPLDVLLAAPSDPARVSVDSVFLVNDLTGIDLTSYEDVQVVDTIPMLPTPGPIFAEQQPLWESRSSEHEIEEEDEASAMSVAEADADERSQAMEDNDCNSGSAQSTPLGHNAEDLGDEDSYSCDDPDQYKKANWREKMDQEDVERVDSDFEEEEHSFVMDLTPRGSPAN